MMSNIKDKRKENDNDKLSEHFQNAKFVIRQKSNVIIKKIIQFESKDDNEKSLNYVFNKNDVVDYVTLVKKKRTRNNNLKVKREYQILLKKIKDCKFLFEKIKFRR